MEETENSQKKGNKDKDWAHNIQERGPKWPPCDLSNKPIFFFKSEEASRIWVQSSFYIECAHQREG